jgi:hypothetical protein
VSWVFKLPLKSSIDFVLAVCDCSILFILSVDSYTNAPICLSSFSRFSRMLEIVTRVVELALRSDKISYLFSDMPVCIS